MDAALRSRSRALASEGRWAALYELLKREPEEAIASDAGLAYRWAEALYHTGRMRQLASYAELYGRVAREQADIPGLMRAMNLAGIADFELGRIDRARSTLERLMEMAEAEGAGEMLARAANGLGAIAELQGERHEALAYYHLALPLYRRAGQARGLAQIHHNLGISYRELERLDDSAQAHGQAVALSETIGYEPLVALGMVGRAETELRRGDLRLSRRLVEHGLLTARRIRDPLGEGEALRVRGLVRLEEAAAAGAGEVRTAFREEWEGALSDLRAAVDLARGAGNPLLQADAERDLGRLLRRLGRPEEARVHLEAAARGFEALGAAARAAELREEAGPRTLGG